MIGALNPERVGAAVAVGGLASLLLLAGATTAWSQTPSARVFSANHADLAGCAATALGKAYPGKVGAINRPGVRAEAVDLIVTEPRGGLLGNVYRGFVRRMTVSIAKVADRQASVEIRPADVDLGADEIGRVWAAVESCGKGRGQPGARTKGRG